MGGKSLLRELILSLKRYIIYIRLSVINYIQKQYIHMPNVISAEETVDLIINKKVSVARYGDGEFAIMEMNKNHNSFQESNTQLGLRLKEVIKAGDENFIVCIPDVFRSLRKYRMKSKMFWLPGLVSGNRKKISGWVNENTYYDSLITRPYMMYKNKSKCKERFSKIKQIWDGREVIIVEGEKTRSGVKNDLFDNCKSVKRILCPTKNAYNKYEEILNCICKYDKKNLILIALGQTATVLAYDLYKEGFQAIDMGHIDLEYEWFLRQAEDKIKICGKFVNEVSGGNLVDDIEDEDYKNQIVDYVL